MRVFLCRQRRILRKPLVHLGNHGSIRSLLRTKYRAASLCAAQRICHITGNLKGALFECWKDRIVGDCAKFLQTFGAQGNRISFFVKQTIAQCLQHAGTTVVCRTSADSNDKVSAFFGDRIFENLPHAVCGGVKRVSVLCWNKRNPCGA